jgi:hypothetical protein
MVLFSVPAALFYLPNRSEQFWQYRDAVISLAFAFSNFIRISPELYGLNFPLMNSILRFVSAG